MTNRRVLCVLLREMQLTINMFLHLYYKNIKLVLHTKATPKIPVYFGGNSLQCYIYKIRKGSF